jgi:hypothetical protein
MDDRMIAQQIVNDGREIREMSMIDLYQLDDEEIILLKREMGIENINDIDLDRSMRILNYLGKLEVAGLNPYDPSKFEQEVMNKYESYALKLQL